MNNREAVRRIKSIVATMVLTPTDETVAAMSDLNQFVADHLEILEAKREQATGNTEEDAAIDSALDNGSKTGFGDEGTASPEEDGGQPDQQFGF